MREINFTVYGDPKPQPRPRFRRMGKFVSTYDPASDDKKNFHQIANHYAPEEPISTPLRVEVNFFLKRPKGHYGTGKNVGKLKVSSPVYHIKKPDVDNLVKFVLDSLNKLYWTDDAIIIILVVGKFYAENEKATRTEVRITKYPSE